MSYLQFFFTLFCQVFVALGINMLMEKDQLLYFFRKPFEGLYKEIEKREQVLSVKTAQEILVIRKEIRKLKKKYYLTKPFFTCITCFASVWGGSVFLSLNGFSLTLLPYLIISCLCAAYIQTLIYVKANI